MALYYNNDGSVSEIIINAIMDGKVTSSAAIVPTILTSSLTGNVVTKNFTSSYQTTLSSTTPTPVAFGAVDANTAIQTKYPSASYANFTFNTNIPVLIPADTTLDAIIDGRITADIDLSHIADASLSPNVKTISAKQFGTTYSNGTVWVIGDDSTLVDVNLGNGFAIVGQQQNNRGWVKFGTNGPLMGHNGNQATLPTPGDGLYAITGSLMVSSSKLMFYNGAAAGTNGWVAIK